MKLYSKQDGYTLYQGNMLDMLEVIKPNTIDSIVTDPPYELNFMNKGWDNAGVSFQVDTWNKCFDVLKPGGYLLAFGGTRTYHRIACAIEDAGFEIRDCIMWLYGSGFPKSMDISKQIDKRNGRNLEIYKEIGSYIKENRLKCNISLSELNKEFGYVAGCNWWESQNDNNVRLPNLQDYLKLKKILNLDDRYDAIIEREEAKGEIIGKRIRGNAGFSNDQVPRPWKEKIGGYYDITAPATNLAKKWEGWGTCLKPAYEPIIVARKPFKGSLVDNVIENGVGGLNIDECRVVNEHFEIKNGDYDNNPNQSCFGNVKRTPKEYDGRFPANVILTYDETDFDEVCGSMPYTKSNGGKTSMPDLRDVGKKSKESIGIDKLSFGQVENAKRKESDYIAPSDSGSAARYFYCAKASKKDRDEGLDEFEKYTTTDGRNKPIDNPFLRGETERKNTHPTVKPTELMQYLVRLVTPKGGTILDPFMGSGSTGKSVMYENKERNADYKFIGIELTEEYLPIAEARINYVYNKLPNKEHDLEEFLKGL